MLDFREITLEDKERVEACARAHNYHLCEHCFVDLYIWRDHYDTKICFLGDFLLVKMRDADSGKEMYLAPIGEGSLCQPVAALREDAAERGNPFIMVSVAEDMIERMETCCPGQFDYSYNEGAADYVYLSEKLQTLSGKKLQSKRNLVNRFLANYEGRWSYEDITPDNVREALKFHFKWCEMNGCMRDHAFFGETCAVGIGLNNWDALGLRGGLLRLDGEVIAFTFGCRATDDMCVVQIEKADHNIPGAYQMINQQFVKRNCTDVMYVNREEDLGLEGLRKAKQSYYPAFLSKKYVAIPKGEAQ